jgi:phosphoglycerate dehydrogenase-like enzyme
VTIPKVAIVPRSNPALSEAVERGGGAVVEPEGADALVWTDPSAPKALAELLAHSPARWVQLPFAGIEQFVEENVIDARRKWTCAKGIYGHATAEHALALLLAGARLLNVHVRSRRWMGEGATASRRLAVSTVMIVGTGGIGTALRDMLLPIGCRIVAVNRSGRPLPGAAQSLPVEHMSIALPETDFVVLAAPATAATERLVNAPFLDAMKDDAWLVNVARGTLVDTDALIASLERGGIGGAALDVTDPEPLPDGHPLWRFDDVIITGHTANTWRMAVPELARLVERNVRRFAAGDELEGVVDPALGY